MNDFKISGKQINRKERMFLEERNSRWCAKCQTVKDAEEFHKGAYSCKSCKKTQMDSWRDRNQNYFEDYRENNQESRSAYNRKWFQDNKDRSRETKRIYKAYQRKNNSQYRIVNSLRSRVRLCLKYKNKIAPTLTLLGCSLEELTKHFESLFTEGMSWDNYGNPNGDHSNSWHIDHIKPCSLFDLTQEEEQRKCFHYSNLQPLWGIDNMKKSNKFV